MVTISLHWPVRGPRPNWWFRLAEAELTLFHHGHAEEARLRLELHLRHRRGRSAPVILRLTAADATALAQAIQAAVQQLAAGPAREQRDTRDGGRSYPPRRAVRRVSAHATCARGGPGTNDGGLASTSGTFGCGVAAPRVCPCVWTHHEPIYRFRPRNPATR